MRRTFGLLTAVIALLLGLQGTATAGVAWFQTRDDHSGHRAGAGVLTVPRLGGAQIGEVVMWTQKRVLVSSAGVVRELTFQGESIEDTSGVVVIAEGNPETARALTMAGCEVHTYRASEIGLNGSGGPTCLTRPILRD